MANTRVSDLSAGGAFADTDTLYVVETAGVGGVKKTLTQLKEWSQDLMNSTLVAGSNIGLTYNDSAGTITVAYTGAAPPASTDDLPEGVTNLYFTNERAQDAVGAMVDSTLVYVDGTPLLTRAALTGDVTAAQGSNATTIANNAVTYAKMQDASAGFVVLGKATTGSGDFAEILLGVDEILGRSGSGNIGGIACTSAGRALLDDAAAVNQRATLGLTIGTDVQAYNANLAAIAALTFAANKIIQATGAGAAQMLDLQIGTYTPTGTIVANLDSFTPQLATFIRIGSVVIQAGLLTVDPTAAGDATTTGRWTLNIASAFSSAAQAAGCVTSGAAQRAGRIQANVANDELEFTFASQITAQTNVPYVVIYTIV